MSEEDRAKALVLMLDYLKDRHIDQLTSLQKVESKVNIRLTVYAGLLGLVTVGVPVLAERAVPQGVLALAFVLVVTFGACLFRTLWLAVSALDVRLDIPGVEPGAFQRAARYEKLALVPVLQNLVVNYAQAVESNWKLIEERSSPGELLKKWSRATMITAFVTVGFVGLVYVTTSPEQPVVREESMAHEEKPQASSQGSKPASSGTDAQPSLEASPQRVELGKSAESTKEQVQTFRDNQTPKKESK